MEIFKSLENNYPYLNFKISGIAVTAMSILVHETLIKK